MQLPAMVDQRTSLISSALQGECNTACAGSDKGIGLQEILNSNAANNLGESRCADLIAPPRSVSSLFDGIAQNKAHTSIVSKGKEEGKNFTRIVY